MTITDFRNYNIQTKTKPLTILANEAEQAIQAAESNLADFIIAFQGYFREQEDSFIDYIVKHGRKLSNIKPVNPDNLDEDIRPENKKLQKFVDGYNWRKKKKDLLTILKYIEVSTIPFGIQNMIALTNRVARIKEKKEKVSLADTIQYVNDPKFAMDAQGFITDRRRDFLYEADRISKNIDSYTSDLIYDQLYDGVEKLESMRDLAVRIEDVFDNCTRSRAVMIARTETMRSFNSATINSYHVAEIEQAQILVANDERTCDTCMALSGLIVLVSEAMGYLPLHPQCRCDWIPVIGKPLLAEPSEEDLENFVLQHPDFNISKADGMPKVFKWERGHLEEVRPLKGMEILKEDALKQGVKLSDAEVTEICNNVVNFSEAQFDTFRELQRIHLETGKWPTKIPGFDIKPAKVKEWIEEIGKIEDFIKYSPNYSKNELIFRGIYPDPLGEKELSKQLMNLSKGDITTMGGTSSWTSDPEIMKEFAKTGKNSFGFILKEGSDNSASIAHLASYAKEKEILISVDSKFKVIEKITYGRIDDVITKKEARKICLEIHDIRGPTRAMNEFVENWIKKVGERNWVIVGEI